MNLEKIRKEFELWIEEKYGGVGLARKSEPGYTHQYESPFTQARWEAWQAATIVQINLKNK